MGRRTIERLPLDWATNERLYLMRIKMIEERTAAPLTHLARLSIFSFLLFGLGFSSSVMGQGAGVAQFSASSYYVDETEGQVIAIVNRERGGVVM